MNLRTWIVIITAIAIPLACITLVLILIGTQPRERPDKRPVQSTPQPIYY